MRPKAYVLGTLASTAMVALLAGGAHAQETIKIGLLATLEGPFAAGGQDGIRGAQVPLQLHNGVAGGQENEFIHGSSHASPDKGGNATRNLGEQDKGDIMIGP